MKSPQTQRFARLPFAWVGVLALLVGCDTTTKLNEPTGGAPVETRQPMASAATLGATGSAAPVAAQSNVTTVDLASQSGAAAAAAAAGTAMIAAPGQRVVYFDFDSYAIKDEFKSVIDNNARLLAANRGKRMVVEGHTDERGGHEYNLALGQKRAAAVVQSLTLLGAAESQLEAVSFGQERPAAQGSDEAAWAKNRRAELKDR